MIKVITYGTYDLLHHGHIRLLERAKALGDYLIVGVTSDDFDKTRGKINVQQSLMERVEAVRKTGLADEIIIEEYEGQKIDDIKKYNIDIFSVGSDWVGKFDYLNEFCMVVYLPRTEGISSSKIRSENAKIKVGIVGSVLEINKFIDESKFVNGMEIIGVYSDNKNIDKYLNVKEITIANTYDYLLQKVDAVYIASIPKDHVKHIEKALVEKKHVLCESPLTLSEKENIRLHELAKNNQCILMDSLKTAYCTAYSRLLLLAKSGKIGDIVSINATCTSLNENYEKAWNSINKWGPTALLPIFNLLGTNYQKKEIITRFNKNKIDVFTKINFIYPNAVATAIVADGIKSEGDLVISGTKGYIYVPSPWWKTEYFEIRYEDFTSNKRYFYQLDGEGIRYELVAFIKAIQTGKNCTNIDDHISNAITNIIDDFYNKVDFIEI